MQFSNAVILAASLASVAFAQDRPNPINSVGEGNGCQAGLSCTVKWTASTGTTTPITLLLRDGNPDALNKGEEIAKDIPNSGSYTFTVPKDSANGKYTIQICTGKCTDAESNYSPMFNVAGGNGNPATVSNAVTGSAEPTGTASGSASATETAGTQTITGTVASTLATSATGSAEPSGTATETESEETASATETETESTSKATAGAPSPNQGSIARSSSLAMALCVFAAVFFIN